jgi:small-conductance mechanosensitive channel/CRP-like cAMP-binding protein
LKEPGLLARYSSDMEPDVSTLRTLALAVAMIMLLGAVYRHLFRRLRPASRLLACLQEGLRFPVAPLVLIYPFWWAVQQLPETAGIADEATYALILALTLVGIEAAMAILFGYLMPASRVRLPGVLPLTLRLFLYGVVGVFFCEEVLQLPIFHTGNLVVLGWVLALYVMFHLIYAFLFKSVEWKHPLAVALRQQLRFWAYLLILTLTAYYAVSAFLHGMGWASRWLQWTLYTLAAIIVIETALCAVFDFYLPHVRKVGVPKLFRDLSRGLAYLGAGLFVVGVVLHYNLSTLIAGSAVLSVILGLALQETLGNFFAGLALSISRPYNLGEFVMVGNLQGRVEKIDWRSTTIRNTEGNLQILPNSLLAKEIIVNASAPTPLSARWIEVGVHYRHPPNLVRRVLLEAARSVPEVMESPPPEVWLMNFGDSAITYRLVVWIRDYGRRWVIDSRVREAIWYRFEREGIEIPYPIRNVIHHRPRPRAERLREVLPLLQHVDFLRALSEQEVELLGERASLQLFAQGEKVFVQGDPGDCFYIIKSGRLQVSVRSPRGEVFFSREMTPGDFFGEMAVLTGEPRSATVEALEDSELIMLDKEDLREILRANPDADRLISEVLARRQLRTAHAEARHQEEMASRASEEQTASGINIDTLSQQLLKKIRDFFSY